jgi:hypothetical protein
MARPRRHSDPARRRLARFAPALALACVAGVARAAEGDAAGALDFSWNAPAPCPSAERVVELAREGLGDLATRGLPAVRARGDVRADEGGGRWRVALRTEGPRGRGERSLEAPTCEQLADEAALVLTLLARTEAERERASERPSGAKGGATGRAAPERSWRALVRAGALVDGGNLPALSFGAGAAAGLVRGAWRVEVAGEYFVPRRRDEGPRLGTGGEVGLAAGGPRACYRPVRPFAGGWEASGCAGGEVGSMWGEGFGLARVKGGSGVWAALTAGAWLNAPLGATPLALRFGGEGGRVVRAPHFDIEGYGRVFEPASWFVRLGLGVEWRSP